MGSRDHSAPGPRSNPSIKCRWLDGPVNEPTAVHVSSSNNQLFIDIDDGPMLAFQLDEAVELTLQLMSQLSLSPEAVRGALPDTPK
jgi:hypothetical protein